MTTYWCCWCGATAERDGPDEWVSCGRCVREFARLLGFIPRAPMFPLEPGEVPGKPAAATRRFVFRDARSGEETGATRVIADPGRVGRRAG
jgi:hypothetical protein